TGTTRCDWTRVGGDRRWPRLSVRRLFVVTVYRLLVRRQKRTGGIYARLHLGTATYAENADLLGWVAGWVINPVLIRSSSQSRSPARPQRPARPYPWHPPGSLRASKPGGSTPSDARAHAK